MDKIKALNETIKMWNWIAFETERLERKVEKEEYKPSNDVKNNCYMCEYTKDSGSCKYCPIDWDSEFKSHAFKCEGAENSPYRNWFLSEDWEDAAKYAKEIYILAQKTLNEFMTGGDILWN